MVRQLDALAVHLQPVGKERVDFEVDFQFNGAFHRPLFVADLYPACKGEGELDVSESEFAVVFGWGVCNAGIIPILAEVSDQNDLLIPLTASVILRSARAVDANVEESIEDGIGILVGMFTEFDGDFPAFAVVEEVADAGSAFDMDVSEFSRVGDGLENEKEKKGRRGAEYQHISGSKAMESSGSRATVVSCLGQK